MKTYETDNPSFCDVLDTIETTDPVHADLINQVNKKLFENTLFLADTLTNFTDETLIEDAFNSTFSYVPSTTVVSDPTAMTLEEVETATNIEWNGETSSDPTAMSSEEVETAINTEWNGETSEDSTAMTSEEIEEATN